MKRFLVYYITIVFLLVGCTNSTELTEKQNHINNLTESLKLANDRLEEVDEELNEVKIENSNLIDKYNSLKQFYASLQEDYSKLSNAYESFTKNIDSYEIKESNLYDPLKIKVGDTVANMMVSNVNAFRNRNNDLVAKVFFLSDEIIISGTFKTIDENEVFSEEIEFIPDDESSKKIPVIAEINWKPVLYFNSKEALKAFGPVGSTGNATISISGFKDARSWPTDEYHYNTIFVRAINVQFD